MNNETGPELINLPKGTKISNLEIKISLKDVDIVKQIIALLKEVSIREDIPKDIKDKINECVGNINGPGYDKIITCQNCGALLQTGKSRIHLKPSNILFGDENKVILKCNCGCKTEYVIN